MQRTWRTGLPAAVFLALLAAFANSEQDASRVGEATAYLQEDLCEEAAVPLSQAIQKDPGNSSLHYALGVCLGKLGKYPAAVEELKKAVDLKAAKPDIWYYLREFWPEAGPGAVDASWSYFQTESTGAEHSNAHVWINLGILYSERLQLDKALDAFTTAMRLAPDSAEARFQAGSAQYSLGNLKEAAEDFRKALAIDKDYAEARAGLALALERSGAPSKEVIEQEEAAYRLKPELRTKLFQARKAALLPDIQKLLASRKRWQDSENPIELGSIMRFSWAGKFRMSWKKRTAPVKPLPPSGPAELSEYSLNLPVGGQRLLWSFLDTPNIRVSVDVVSGNPVITVHRIPDSRIRHDPEGTLLFRGPPAPDTRITLDSQWEAVVQRFAQEELTLKIVPLKKPKP